MYAFKKERNVRRVDAFREIEMIKIDSQKRQTDKEAGELITTKLSGSPRL